MDTTEISRVAKKSVRWSLLGEIFSKIATPLSTMVLARLLSPEIYGIATAVLLIVTFCESVTESGFAKFIIQHDCNSKEEYQKNFSVSFITSLLLTILLCVAIAFLRFPLSKAVGNSGYEMVLVISCIQVPFAAVNALFSADLRRDFHFKKLFLIRIIQCIIPFAVTVPLAILKFSYWSLVIGSIVTQAAITPILFIVCRKRLKLYFSFEVFRKTFSASFPMILESIVIWLCTWTSTIVAANLFNTATVGLVKVSNSTVNSIFAIFGTAFTAVLFPALSRLKNDDKAFKETFYTLQSSALALMIPLGIGCYFYASTVTDIFLGSKWTEAAFVIGVFALTKPLLMCFNNFLSEVFRSKGHFYFSIFYQVGMLLIDLTLKITLGKISYEWFIWATVISNVLTTLLVLFILQFKYKISVFEQSKSFFASLLCCVFMIPMVLFVKTTKSSFISSIAQALVCATAYFAGFIILYPKRFEESLLILVGKI